MASSTRQESIKKNLKSNCRSMKKPRPKTKFKTAALSLKLTLSILAQIKIRGICPKPNTPLARKKKN